MQIENLDQGFEETYKDYKERGLKLLEDIEALANKDIDYAEKCLKMHFISGMKNKDLKLTAKREKHRKFRDLIQFLADEYVACEQMAAIEKRLEICRLAEIKNKNSNTQIWDASDQKENFSYQNNNFNKNNNNVCYRDNKFGTQHRKFGNENRNFDNQNDILYSQSAENFQNDLDQDFQQCNYNCRNCDNEDNFQFGFPNQINFANNQNQRFNNTNNNIQPKN